MAQTRSIWGNLWKNFVASLRPRKPNGNLMGKDQFGNKYFEIPSDPRNGKPRASRWFEPCESEKFDQELPAEWEAWLRGRRTAVPLDEEILQNNALAQMKKEKAKIIDDKAASYRADNPELVHSSNPQEKPRFPERKEYELMPGETQDRAKPPS